MTTEPTPEYEPTAECEATSECEPSGEPEGLPEGIMGSASDLEIVMPGFALVTFIVIGILLYSMATQPDWWRAKLFGRRSSGPYRASFPLDSGHHLMTAADRIIQNEFMKFQNNPFPLLRIAMPTALSLLFCPAALYMYAPLSKAFWPPELFDEVPNINDAIACFLTPAGLVYAIAFGFAFQEAVLEITTYSTNIRLLVGAIHQLQAITERTNILRSEQKCNILRALKKEVVKYMAIFIGRESPSDLWEVVDILREPCKGEGDYLDRRLTKEILNCVMIISSTPQFTVIKRINILQWTFLELLGFISFFGVLLVKAQSYRLELTICILTVFSISLFCYVLADFDDPYHGFFKVDLSGLCGVIERLEEHFTKLHQGTLNASSIILQYDMEDI